MSSHRAAAVCFLLLAVPGCGSDKVVAPPSAPPSDTNSELLVSAPISNADLPGADSTGSVVFVSAPPHTLPRVASVVVRGAEAQSVAATLRDGGFDPVSLRAEDGDVLVVTLTDSNGTTRSEELAVRSRRPPRVVRTSLGSQHTDVPLNVVIRVVFSAPIDLESARKGVILTKAAGDTVPGTVVAVGAVAVEYVVSAGSLDPETTYRLNLSTDVRDVLGQALAAPISIEFSTGSVGAPVPTTGLDLAIAPASLTVDQGKSAQAALTIKRGIIGGELFTGAVTLSATASPGISVTLNASRMESGDTAAILQVTADSAAALGTRTVIVRGITDGPGSVTVTRRLTIAVTLAPPTIGLGVAPTSVSLVRGGRTERVELWIWRSPSLTDPVSLSLGGEGPGIRASLDVSSLFLLSSSANISLSADGAAPLGTSTILVGATGANERGSASASRTLTVNVVAPSGSITLASTSGQLYVAANGPPVTSSIAIERSPPFAGPVELTVQGAPRGLIATVSPASATATSATLSVSALTEVVNRTYTLAIVGTGSGIANAVDSVSVSVEGGTPPPSVTLNPGTLNVTAGGGSASTSVTSSPGFVPLPIRGRPYLTLDRRSLPDDVTVERNGQTLTAQAAATAASGTYVVAVILQVMSLAEPLQGSIEIARAQLQVVVQGAVGLHGK